MTKRTIETWPVGERRQDSRVDEEDRVSVELISDIQLPPGKKFFNALTKDISPGGARIMTNAVLPVGTPVSLEIVLSGRRKLIHATGKIRWSRDVYEEKLFEMGVEFVGMSPEDKLILLEHTYRRR
jgi:uncharacterized protein (TIGR02266 family)